MNENLTYSPVGIALTKSFESGPRLTAFDDRYGTWTIGWGRTKGVKEGDTCTTDQAEQWLQEDLAEAARLVRAQIMCQLEQNEFDALVDFTYNEGGGNLYISDIRKALNAGDKEAAAAGFYHFVKAGGKFSKGLKRRRDAEVAMFKGEM